MQTFDTPEPISVVIDIGAGQIRIDASDRADTVVYVVPSNENDDADVECAERARVEFANGELVVKAPRSKSISLFGSGGSVDVKVDLPTDSRVDATATADIQTRGRLGACKFSTSYGEINIDQTGDLRSQASSGDITVSKSVGHTDLTTANGRIRVHQIDGTAAIRTTNGAITVGEVTGEARLNTAHGDITVERALAGLLAKTSSGSARISQVERGSIVLESAYGQIDVGIRSGIAAWLNLDTSYGHVHVPLELREPPEQTTQTVEVSARTNYGDIVISRTQPA
ncbi:DUF4097 family beta strand repeat-containing protein [Acrocarpospora sp. B8E8]|uniref:DUF4097 family beta strand repeat-containing protein n=1 Tax=Acrocarpospora sp. B8E8 TaxID=3153572 RepID=UPI00325E3086